MIRLCEAVYRKEVVSPEACEEMLEHLRACEDKDKFPRLLPPEVKVAFKTGSLAETRTAAGIIEWPGGPVALCVLSCENEDKRWVPDNAGNRLCAEIARAVLRSFQRRRIRREIREHQTEVRGRDARGTVIGEGPWLFTGRLGARQALMPEASAPNQDVDSRSSRCRRHRKISGSACGLPSRSTQASVEWPSARSRPSRKTSY